MDTLQIEHVFASDSHGRSVVRGVVSRDGLPTAVDTYPTAFVCNTHTGDQPGQHWIAIYASSKKTGEYFDSFGLPPLYPAFRRFLQDNCEEWTYNNKTFQSPLSTVCGQYCAAYLLLRSRGVPMINFVKTFNTDLVANDRRVFNWIKDIG